jgi:hypothetical protein
MPDVVTLDVLDSDAGELRAQLVRLENRVRMLLAIVGLLFCVLRISGVRLNGARVLSGDGKTKLLGAIAHARSSIKLTVVLRLIGLSPSRHYAWTKRQEECSLDDRSSCPRFALGQLTATEVRAMHDMATSPEHRHISVRALAIHAQRLGRVFVSAGTWLRFPLAFDGILLGQVLRIFTDTVAANPVELQGSRIDLVPARVRLSLGYLNIFRGRILGRLRRGRRVGDPKFIGQREEAWICSPHLESSDHCGCQDVYVDPANTSPE